MNDFLNQIIETLRSSMDNQFMSGGLVLMFVGSALALLRNLPRRAWGLAKRQFTVSVDIISTDALFGWTIAWLNAQPYSLKARRLSASSGESTGGGVVAKAADNGGDDKPTILFTPAPGFHFFWLKGQPVWLTRERKEGGGKDGGWSIFSETITMNTLGRDPSLIRSILEEARDQAYTDLKLVGIYVGQWGEWHRVHEIVPRSLDSVILPQGVVPSLLRDLRTFLSSEEWYRERGIPWRRGLLFEGIPGTGKTSIVSALAGELGLDLYTCNITDRGMNDQSLLSSLLKVKPKSAILLEDIDGLVDGREMQGESGVTFSGLLNALDGVASKPGTVTFMTTNHIDQLDPALIRSGRVDRQESFTQATDDQASRFYDRFFNGALKPSWNPATYGPMTIADIQAVLMAHRDNPSKALAEIAKRKNGGTP